MARRGEKDRLRPAHEAAEPIRIGISSCLLGERVRYDGGHKRDAWITRVLARHVELVGLCPEVGIGLGVPRAPIRLVGDPTRPRAVGVADPDRDVTAALAAFTRGAAPALADLSGYIFKSRSPSCGLRGVPVYGPRGGVRGGSGIHAGAVRRRHPLLPLVEECELDDPASRAHFLERVFAYRRWRTFAAAPGHAGALADFHARHELTLMAHGAASCRALARLAAQARRRPSRALADAYGRAFLAAFVRPATRPRHAAVLRRIAGHLRPGLDRAERLQLREAIEAYRLGTSARVVPLRLLRRHLRRHPDPDLAQQTYLEPAPAWTRAEAQ